MTKAKIVAPENPLRQKIGALPAFDAAALARAEAALKALSSEFQGWMEEEVERLTEARTLAKSQAYDDSSLEAVYARAHDIKGLGSTYDYPLVTMMAASLCRLVESRSGRAKAKTRPTIVDAHVDGIRAMVRSKIKATDHPVGKQLLAELEQKVTDLLAA